MRLIVLFLVVLAGCYHDSDPRLLDRGVYIEGSPIAEEITPVVWRGRVITILFLRPQNGTDSIQINDAETGRELAKFPTPDFCIGSAVVMDDTLYVFGTTGLDNRTAVAARGNRVEMISTRDMKNWSDRRVVFQAQPGEAIWNTSITRGPDGFVMAYDASGEGIASFAQRFAASGDLLHWRSVGGTFSANEYSTAATIVYADGYYYLMHTRTIEKPAGAFSWHLATFVARSRDLMQWEFQKKRYSVAPRRMIGASDVDVIEHGGVVRVFFSDGNQGVNGAAQQSVMLGIYRGPMSDYLEHFFH